MAQDTNVFKDKCFVRIENDNGGGEGFYLNGAVSRITIEDEKEITTFEKILVGNILKKILVGNIHPAERNITWTVKVESKGRG